MWKVALALSMFCTNAEACLGPESERAQESAATVVFEGRPIAYSQTSAVLAQPNAVNVGPPDTLGKIKFAVTRAISGEKRSEWTVLMRGERLPASLKAFTDRFGKHMRVGLRALPHDPDRLPADLRGTLFVVDAACGEDWLLRPISKK